MRIYWWWWWLSWELGASRLLFFLDPCGPDLNCLSRRERCGRARAYSPPGTLVKAVTARER